MSEAHPSKDDHRQPSVVPPRLPKAIQKARETSEAARETLARIHQALDHTRQLLQEKKDIIHYNHARREHRAEQTASHAPAILGIGTDILLIGESLAGVRLFRYALNECGLSGAVTVLKQRSEVEVFVHQAATSAHPFPPRLIITASRIPGMEIEEILAAVRRVPAYH